MNAVPSIASTFRPIHAIRAGLGALALSLSTAVRAAVEASPGVSGSAMLQMLLGLVLIIGLLFSGAYALRKLNGGRSFGQSGPLRIVGGLMIGPRERIVMIEVGDTWVVVGIVPGQIKTLHTLPKGELPASAGTAKPFGQWLKQMSDRTHAAS